MFIEKIVIYAILLFAILCCGCTDVKEPEIEEPFDIIEIEYTYSFSYYNSTFPIPNFPMYLGMGMDSKKINYTTVEWEDIQAFSEKRAEVTCESMLTGRGGYSIEIYEDFELSNLEFNVTSLDKAVLENSTEVSFVTNVSNDQGWYVIIEASLEYKRYESFGEPMIEDVGSIAMDNIEDSLTIIYESAPKDYFEYKLDAVDDVHHHGTIHKPIGDYITSNEFEKTEILDSESGWNNPAVFYDFIFEDMYNTYGDFNHEEQYKETVIHDSNHREYSFEYYITPKGNKQIIHIYYGTLNVKKLQNQDME